MHSSSVHLLSLNHTILNSSKSFRTSVRCPITVAIRARDQLPASWVAELPLIRCKAAVTSMHRIWVREPQLRTNTVPTIVSHQITPPTHHKCSTRRQAAAYSSTKVPCQLRSYRWSPNKTAGVGRPSPAALALQAVQALLRLNNNTFSSSNKTGAGSSISRTDWPEDAQRHSVHTLFAFETINLCS